MPMTNERDRITVVLDLRCLQDPNFARRGIGRHALTLLRYAPQDFRLVGLVDKTLPDLLPEAREAVAAVYPNAYAASAAGTPEAPLASVIMLSPMTHDPLFVARLLSDSDLLRAAVVYDFIPRRMPESYLPTPAHRLGYALALRWLLRCDMFLPISRSSADELAVLPGVAESQISVTGCGYDSAFEGAAANRAHPRHLLVVAGPDVRKNPEVVIRAHAGSLAMQADAGIPLVIAGNYGEADGESFRAIATAAGGRADLIEVPGHISDSRLLDLYAHAYAIVCPSRDEGFSIPVIEGMAAGLPCLASDIPAHAELVTDSNSRFPVDDHASLRTKLEQVISDPDLRATMLARQADVWPRFRSDAVAARFWEAMCQRLTLGAPSVLRGHRPRVALLSPVPPERSGVADYTAASCAELGRLTDLHIFTETEQPAPLSHVSSVRPLSALPHLHGGFDRVISVVGNSHLHLGIFEMLLRYGGACIAHDARLLGFYTMLLGRQRALAVASKELGRGVTEAELDAWLSDEGKLEALFLGEIAENAAPTIVHSPATASLFRNRYGAEPVYLPFSIYRPWAAEELTPTRRAAARKRLGIPDNEVAIATFGFVQSSKAPEECIWALEILRSWEIPARLHFVGGWHMDTSKLKALINELNIQEYVRIADTFVSEQTYRDYLIGADLAVQLRTYGFGGLSGALLDCVSAGLPTVTNSSLGKAVGIPKGYTRSIPDVISPQLLAEALADLLSAGRGGEQQELERHAFSEERSFVSYCRELCINLGLDVPPTVASV